MLFAIFFFAVAQISGTAVPFSPSVALRKLPELVRLHAPYTIFDDNKARTLNVSHVPQMAQQTARFGANVVWVPGGMSQFETLSVEERKALLAAWVAANKQLNLGLYIIAHVGTDAVEEAVDLARHAAQVGADAIASVPSVYEHPANVDELLQWLSPIAAGAPHLPLFYYHIPGTTGATNIKIFELLSAAPKALPQLIGVKYVSSDMADWYLSVRTFNSSHALLFAPEPKLQSFATGVGRGAVLAEDFYAPTYLRMFGEYFLKGDSDAARDEQQWKYDVEAVFARYSGSPKRAVYKRFNGVDLGPPRLPQEPMDPHLESQLFNDLQPLGFFSQLPPNITTL